MAIAERLHSTQKGERNEIQDCKNDIRKKWRYLFPVFVPSIGSGGSVLIGVEDDDDFRHYKGMENANPTAPGFDDYEDEDLYADPSENNGRRGGEIEDSESRSDTESEDNYQEEGSESGQGRDEPEFDLPPGFGATSTRRNPLLDMAYEEEDDRL